MVWHILVISTLAAFLILAVMYFIVPWPGGESAPEVAPEGAPEQVDPDAGQDAVEPEPEPATPDTPSPPP